MELLKLILYLILIYICKGSMTPKFVESRIKDIKFTSRKLWNEFIEIFISHNVELTVYPKINMQNIIFILKCKAKSFTLIMIRNQTDEAVKSVSGQIHQMSYGAYTKMYEFHVNKNVATNLTFITINFNSPLANCSTAQNFVSILAMPQSSLYTYCGFYSLFYLYPKINNFTIYITNYPLEYFEVHLLFSVIDSDLIYTIKGPNIFDDFHTPTQVLPYHDAIIQKTYTLNSYLITVSKVYRIILGINELRQKQFVIFDGPGFTYDILENNVGKQMTSSFTCVLLFFKQ